MDIHLHFLLFQVLPFDDDASHILSLFCFIMKDVFFFAIQGCVFLTHQVRKHVSTNEAFLLLISIIHPHNTFMVSYAASTRMIFFPRKRKEFRLFFVAR